MSKKTEKNNIVQPDFGTTQPNVSETTEEEMMTQAYMDNMCLAVGRSTLEWTMLATKEEYLQHMAELYDYFNKEKEENNSKIEVTKPKIILPN